MTIHVNAAPSLAPIPLRQLPLQPKVSVVISNYNYAEYIGEAIESVLAQTYEHLELIICDDGSTDNSREIITRYTVLDPRVSLLAKKNGGQASGFNAAFATCTGDLICFLDSDDVYRLTKVACLVEAYRRAPEAGFGVHPIQRVNKHRRPRGVSPRPAFLPQGWHGESILQKGGVLAYTPPTSGLSLHRSVAERIFPLPESEQLSCLADQVITRFAPLLTPVVAVRDVLAEYRLHGANSFERSRITAASIHRRITTCMDLWVGQRDFLELLDPRLVHQLQPLAESRYFMHLEYIYARMSRSSSLRSSHDRYIRDIQRTDPGQHHRMLWFWKLSIYFPGFVFDGLINLLIGQSRLKEILGKLRAIAESPRSLAHRRVPEN